MNPAFVLLVTIGLIALWFLLSFLYKPLGKFVYRIGKDAMDEINEVDEEKETEE